MAYKFYKTNGIEEIKPINKDFSHVSDPYKLYDLLDYIWCEYSCAPRMRKDWSESNKTLGQCSITSFLVQDIFGGEVYGVPLEDGSFHCFNVVGDKEFDLTSEQFGNTKLVYTRNFPQNREVHFASEEKYQRYLYLREKVLIHK